MHKKRGQVSIELIITVGFALLMIIPLTVLMFEHTAQTYKNVNNNQAGLIARKITDAADSVYYLGYPSSLTLKVYMPENIEFINVSGRELVFYDKSGSEIVSISKINLTGSLSSSSGLRFIRISALENQTPYQVNITEDIK